MTSLARLTTRGAHRRRAILSSAATLFAREGYAAVGMDDIGAAAGVTGPAIYRHFASKSAVLTAVIDGIIDAVDGPEPAQGRLGPLEAADPTAALNARLRRYASGVAQRRGLMAVFVREVHHLPEEYADGLRRRQRLLVSHWRALLAAIHPDWSTERVRTAVHGVFGILNSVGSFVSPLGNDDLAEQLVELSCASLRVHYSEVRYSDR